MPELVARQTQHDGHTWLTLTARSIEIGAWVMCRAEDSMEVKR